MTKLKNLNCDKTQIMTKFNNLKYDKTQIVTKLKLRRNSNCDKTQVLTKLKNSKCDKTQVVIKPKNWNGVKTQKLELWQNILTPRQPMRCSLGSVLQLSRCFYKDLKFVEKGPKGRHICASESQHVLYAWDIKFYPISTFKILGSSTRS